MLMPASGPRPIRRARRAQAGRRARPRTPGMHTRHAGPGSTRPRRRAAARCSSALLVLLPLAAAGVTNAASIESIPTALIPTPRSISSHGTARTFAPACSVRSDSARDDVYALRLVRALVASGRPGQPRAAATLSEVELRAAIPACVPEGAIASESYTLEVGADRV